MEDDHPTSEQLHALGGLLHMALKEMRLLGWDGQAEQAAELADALCQLPLRMHSREFRWEHFEQSLGAYQHRYPDRQPALNYVQLLRHIRGLRASATPVTVLYNDSVSR